MDTTSLQLELGRELKQFAGKPITPELKNQVLNTILNFYDRVGIEIGEMKSWVEDVVDWTLEK